MEWSSPGPVGQWNETERNGGERKRSRCVYPLTATYILLSEQSARWLCGQSGSLLAPGAGGRGFWRPGTGAVVDSRGRITGGGC